GILHVIGPEQGITLPGMTIACGDSHTTTHGAFAALAFGIGTSEIEHILSTQCLLLKKLKTLRTRIGGELPPYVAPKDLAVAMSMEARMTLCNLAIEAGARCAMVAFDDTTAAYLKGRPLAPSGAQWDAAEAYWRTLHSDPEARFDRELQLDAASIRPHVTWGTSPEMVTDVDGRVPDPAAERDPGKRRGMHQALVYMCLEPGTPIREI